MHSKMANLWKLSVKRSVMTLLCIILITKGKFVDGFGVMKKLMQKSSNVFQFLEHPSKDSTSVDAVIIVSKS